MSDKNNNLQKKDSQKTSLPKIPQTPIKSLISKENQEIKSTSLKKSAMAEKIQSIDFKSYWETIKPPVILMIICAVVCAMLVVAYNVTYVDNKGVITDKLRAGCEEVIGDGEYEMLTDITVEGVTSIIVDREKQACAIEIIADGYAKEGLHLLIGIDSSGAVSGISIISIGETPGLGTKVQDKSFLDKFKGVNSTEINVDNITGATYSSKGVKSAVALAIETYQNEKEAIFSE